VTVAVVAYAVAAAHVGYVASPDTAAKSDEPEELLNEPKPSGMTSVAGDDDLVTSQFGSRLSRSAP